MTLVSHGWLREKLRFVDKITCFVTLYLVRLIVDNRNTEVYIGVVCPVLIP